MIYTIFRREYLNIVSKKSFWLGILLIPLIMVIIFGIQIAAFMFSEEESYTFLIPGEDSPAMFQQLTSKNENIIYEWVEDSTLNELMSRKANKIAVLELPTQEQIDAVNPKLLYRFHSTDNINLGLSESVERNLRKIIEDYKLEQAGLAQEELDELDFSLSSRTIKDGKESNSFLASAAGYVMGFLMYMMLIIFGSMLMQGVIEEKTNRIVEIIVSSVKPFQFMMGKILALGAAGLTQFLLLISISAISFFAFSLVAGSFMGPTEVDLAQIQAATEQAPEEAKNAMDDMLLAVYSFKWSILWLFPLYFVGGFLLYGSLMAAAGAAVDNIQDASQFTTPIMMLLVIPFTIMIPVIQNPNSGLAVFGSIFPFFSPIVMMGRIGITEVPWYEVILSLGLLALTIWGCIWFAAKIYRVGILMYGKKPSFKELFKWLRYS
ncbi:MAG: ABC transporter permease [Bacteroidota bacterium]